MEIKTDIWTILATILLLFYVLNDLVKAIGKGIRSYKGKSPDKEKEHPNFGLMNEYTKLTNKCTSYVDDNNRLKAENGVLERQIKDVRKDWTAACDKIGELNDTILDSNHIIKSKNDHLAELSEKLKNAANATNESNEKLNIQIRENKRLAIELEKCQERPVIAPQGRD